MPAPVTPKTEAILSEIFSSIQGEGILVGCRQIFIRFANCNLDCSYCDTDYAAKDSCRIENPPGSDHFTYLPNPVSLDNLLELVRSWVHQAPGAHHSISLTGGEPLLQADTLVHWLPELRKLLPIYLETNGTLPHHLEPVLPYLDWVSMDIKLSSMTGLVTDWRTHRRFLQLAITTGCYVKMVVGAETPELELRLGAELVADISPEIPLVLQPVTTTGKSNLSASRLLDMQQLVAAIHSNVRIIPQTHRYLNVL